jgi:hypothetical protein
MHVEQRNVHNRTHLIRIQKKIADDVQARDHITTMQLNQILSNLGKTTRHQPKPNDTRCH